MKLIFCLKRICIPIFVYLLFLFHLSKTNDLFCNKTHPILKDDECLSVYCSEEEFNSSICIINNEIIKT